MTLFNYRRSLDIFLLGYSNVCLTRTYLCSASFAKGREILNLRPVVLCSGQVKTQAQESADPGFKSRLAVHRNCRRLHNAFVIECDKV